MFELSRDYERAFELIKQGDRLPCWLDYKEGIRDIAVAKMTDYGDCLIGVRGWAYLDFSGEQLETNVLFLSYCNDLNIEFYLPQRVNDRDGPLSQVR
jgi:hypothetical protein